MSEAMKYIITFIAGSCSVFISKWIGFGLYRRTNRRRLVNSIRALGERQCPRCNCRHFDVYMNRDCNAVRIVCRHCGNQIIGTAKTIRSVWDEPLAKKSSK